MKAKIQTIFIVFLFLFNNQICFSQPLVIEWEKSFGGSSLDFSGKILPLEEGGFMLLSSSFSDDGDFSENYGDFDIWLMKINEDGELIWKRRYGGSGYDRSGDLIETSDGNFLMTAFTDSEDFDFSDKIGFIDAYVLKLDKDGNIIWSQVFGGTDEDLLAEIREVEDGSFIINGLTYSNDGDIENNNGLSDIWTIKIDSLGNLIWSKTFGGSNYDGGSFYYLENEDVLVFGNTRSTDGDIGLSNRGGTDGFAIMFDSEMDILWKKNYGGIHHDIILTGIEVSDGFIFCGNVFPDTPGNLGDSDLWIFKINNSGQLKWSKNYGGSSGENAKGILEVKENEWVVYGETSSSDGNVSKNYGELNFKDIWMVGIDQYGQLLWEKSYGGSKSEGVSTLIKTQDGYMLYGSSKSSDFDVSENKGENDLWLVKMRDSIPLLIIEPNEACEFSLFPNPVIENQITIDLPMPIIESFAIQVYDMMGKLVADYPKIENDALEIQLDLPRGLMAGIYYVKIDCPTSSGQAKFIKVN